MDKNGIPVTDAYESMFGNESNEAENFIPSMLPLKLNRQLIDSVMEKARKEKKWVLAFVIGTKPCFYKFYGSIIAANNADIPSFIVNSNQHYDDILSHGLVEFNLNGQVACNLSIRGDLAQKSAELMMKISWLARHLKKKWHDVTVVPVVLGDTIMTAIVPAAWMFSRMEKAIQIEAGLRSMAPEVIKRYKDVDSHTFIDQQFNGKWLLLRNEPFPEQWDTYTSAAGSEFLFAPVSLNKEHLIREGYPESNIWTTGGVVVDALEFKRKSKSEKSIFDVYPALEKGEWIRMDIHRRENLTPTRFRAIIGAMEELVKKGQNVNFIEMSATRTALDFYQMRPIMERLAKHKNFLHTNVWPEYAHVIEFFESKNALAAFTDSGGIQEELNLIGKPCITCRFSTDRPETVYDAKTNVIVPPINSKFVAGNIDYIIKNRELMAGMAKSSAIYGKDVGRKIMSVVSGLIQKGEKPFKWSHEALGIWKEDDNGVNYL
jgi:UDP-N-acetylglucosamine 2-epimerase